MTARTRPSPGPLAASGILRAAVCAGLSTFGLDLDPTRNREARGEAVISTSSSPARILVIPADEERIVARATAETIAAGTR